MPFISVDATICTRQGACIDSCPYQLLHRDPQGLPVEREGAAGACLRCGHCVSVCPSGALSNTYLNRDLFVEVAGLGRGDALAHLMRTRRSVRSFLQEDVPKTELKALFEVTRYAPTGRNTQNLWWIVTTGRAQTLPLARLARKWMRSVLHPERADADWPEDDDPVLRGAPHLILCCGPEDSSWGPTDAAIAVAHLELLAASRGLGACWAGAFVRAAEAFAPLWEALAMPQGQKLHAGLFLGRPRYRHRLVPPRNPAAIDWR